MKISSAFKNIQHEKHKLHARKWGMSVPGLRVFTATWVVLFHRPWNTSPNWPPPSLFISLMDFRSISHWSTVLYDRPWVCGASIYSNGKTFILDAIMWFYIGNLTQDWYSSRLFASPSCMVHPDGRKDHRPVWSNVPPTPSGLKTICSLKQSSGHFLFFSACNASLSHCPTLKQESTHPALNSTTKPMFHSMW